MHLTHENLRARFRELTERSEAIRAASAPQRAALDKHVNDAAEKTRELTEAVQKTEKGLFNIEQERALISRALGGKTSEPIEANEETPA